MKNITIKLKLIILFIFIKIVPVVIISYTMYLGITHLEKYVEDSTRYLFNESKEIILSTANESIDKSVVSLDAKSQESLERHSSKIATSVANFLYERDKDLLFLSQLDINEEVLKAFYKTKTRNIIVHEEYKYDDKTSSWISIKEKATKTKEKETAELEDNKKNFNKIEVEDFLSKPIPIYKEISFFNTKGQEKYKISNINKNLLDISNKKNTYINSESYFSQITDLKEGEIYVSDVIGEQVKSKVIGTYNKAKAKKVKIEFEPMLSAYAGKENPVGKKFEGIIRFITPVFKNEVKIGYISLALDHEHIMQFTDTANTTEKETLQNISDASSGNYAFMWSYEGKNISHPRDYFIVGYNKETGREEMPWLSKDIAVKFKESKQNINDFLESYPKFEQQSLKKKANIEQLIKDGTIGLDCRYLNFAPQCQGWMQLTKDGGYGSFVIFWSNVWKLTTAATIPYYTGQYKNTKRGFGFVTIGANTEEFHSAANEIKENIKNILSDQNNKMKIISDENNFEITGLIKSLINQLSVLTIIMIIFIIAIAIWLSNYLTSKLKNIFIGTEKFSNNDFHYRIELKSNDEIGILEKSFNGMASKIESLVKKQNELNNNLEEKVSIKTKELTFINQNLENEISKRTDSLNKSLIEVKKADEAKTVFLANMSHEIRTPLNAIIGFSELLSSNEKLDISTIKQSKIINTSANSLLKIINDILDISKIGNGNFDLYLEEIDLSVISKNVVELFSQKANEKKIKLIFNYQDTIPKKILGDGLRIKQILSNFLSNAIKFTPEYGIVTLNIHILKALDKDISIRFEIIDTGIGIKEEEISNIFSAFIQVNNKSNRQFEGTGLGLSICTHIVEAMNSKIKVESIQNEGSKFWFDITFKTISKSKIIHTPINKTNVNNLLNLSNKNELENNFKRKILVAEDNKANQELISYILESMNIDFKIVSNGLDALNRYKEEQYDLILMDINMPIMDGIESFKQIREYEKENNKKLSKIIALTANAIKGDKEKYISLGMNDYLSKPINTKALEGIFNKYLNNSPSKELNKFDISKIAINLGVGEKIASKIVDKFLKDIKKDLKELEVIINDEDIEEIKQKAHYIKNSCLNVCKNKECRILEKMEEDTLTIADAKTLYKELIEII